MPVQNGLLLVDPVCHWTPQTKAVPGWFPNTTNQETLHWERAGIDHSKYSKLPSHPRTMTQYARRFQKGAVAPDKAQQISAAQKTTELSPSKSFTFQIFQSPSYGRSALMGNHGKPTFAVKLRLRILGTLGKGLLCPKAEPEVCAGEGALDSPRIPDSICKYCKWNLTAKWNGSK